MLQAAKHTAKIKAAQELTQKELVFSGTLMGNLGTHVQSYESKDSCLNFTDF